jgi:hypothetical protein
VSFSKANDNSTIQNESNYIDQTHKTLSETIVKWSEIIDTMVSNWIEEYETNTTIENNDTNTTIENNETNITAAENNEVNILTTRDNNDTNITTEDNKKIKTSTFQTNLPLDRTDAIANAPINKTTTVANAPDNTLEDRVNSVDSFFQNDKYLNETENTYIRIRAESNFQSKDSSDYDMNIRAQLPFKKSRKNLRIFVENINVDNANDILQDVKDDDNSPDIGLHYFKPFKMVQSRYSIGLSGINPFVKARFNMPIKTDQWLIDMVQLFEYSTDDKFEEETTIFFDKEVGKKSLLRIQLYRSTLNEVNGMNYALSLTYFKSLKTHTGFGFGQSFYGNTEYEYTTEKGDPHPKTKKYGGIHDYVTSISWRTNVWRKWFFVEVRPSVSFHKQYDYDPNYRVGVFFDFYFGRFN